MRIIIDCTIDNEDVWMDIYDTIKHISIKEGIKQGQYILNNSLYIYRDLDNLYIVDGKGGRYDMNTLEVRILQSANPKKLEEEINNFLYNFSRSEIESIKYNIKDNKNGGLLHTAIVTYLV